MGNAKQTLLINNNDVNNKGVVGVCVSNNIDILSFIGNSLDLLYRSRDLSYKSNEIIEMNHMVIKLCTPIIFKEWEHLKPYYSIVHCDRHILKVDKDEFKDVWIKTKKIFDVYSEDNVTAVYSRNKMFYNKSTIKNGKYRLNIHSHDSIDDTNISFHTDDLKMLEDVLYLLIKQYGDCTKYMISVRLDSTALIFLFMFDRDNTSWSNKFEMYNVQGCDDYDIEWGNNVPVVNIKSDNKCLHEMMPTLNKMIADNTM